jgi:hypothetical protein
MHTESREGLRRLLWFVAIWAAGVLLFAAVTLLFRSLIG